MYACKVSKVRAFWWTHGESHPGFVHAMNACYYYTMGPLLKFSRIIFYCKALGVICLLNLQNTQPVQSEIRPKRSTKPEKT